MATMTHRTTFAFDQKTIGRLKNLSLRWHVSQAEVIRRSLAQAEKEESSEHDPIKMLATLHESGRGLSKEIGDAYVEEVYEDRRHWRGE